MQIIKPIIKIFLLMLPLHSMSQSTYLNQGDKSNHFIERLEIKQGHTSNINFSTTRPFSRKAIVQTFSQTDSSCGVDKKYFDSLNIPISEDESNGNLNKVDKYNLQSLLMNNSEWLSSPNDYFYSNYPALNALYKTKANMLEVNNDNFFLAINPILNIGLGKENNNNRSIFINSRGVAIRGLIAKKLGFSSILTDVQERGPLFYQSKVNELRAVPGYGFYKSFKTNGYDYFDARGYISFGAIKEHLNFQFGYDKNFIGDGYRSLFLSDWGNSNLFLKANLKIWKLNYQSLFMELMPQFKKSGDNLLPRKYAAMHHLSINVGKRLNFGLFEGVIFGRQNHFDFQYLNPIIFYRHIEGTVGSPDNAVAGLNFKANVAHSFQFYGQLLLDEFRINDLKKNPDSWVNKYGYQLGVKYIDAFGIDNLDLQLETNRVRPFTYTHNDTIANYTHYNQPLAHPFGANFQEYIAIAKYQPFPKLTIDATAMYYVKGLDSASNNYGGNIFKDYNSRTGENNFYLANGLKVKCLNTFINIAYELKQNLFIEASIINRNYKIKNSGTINSTIISGGLRLNIFRRNYDY